MQLYTIKPLVLTRRTYSGWDYPNDAIVYEANPLSDIKITVVLWGGIYSSDYTWKVKNKADAHAQGAPDEFVFASGKASTLKSATEAAQAAYVKLLEEALEEHK